MAGFRFLFAPFLASTVLSLGTIAQGQTPTNDANRASAQIEQRQEHIHGGSDIAVRIKLNEPLPTGAHFDLRLTPVAVSQELSISSGEPVNRERTEFILHTKLPEKAFPGPWHVGIVWLFLPGASWTTSQIAVNDVTFTVEGDKIPLPTKGTATLLSEAR